MRPSHILLTGGTGVLGLELLPRLLAAEPGTRVTLLLRGRTPAELAERLRRLRRYVRCFWPELDLSRVDAVQGDIGRPDLGLAPEARRCLQGRITRIVHAAARTRFDRPLAELRPTNALGTASLLGLAAGCARLERFAHVSTAYVAGTRSGRIREEELDRGQGFLNDYQRSKLEAELMVRSRMGELPLTVFRPSIIVGDSTDGHISSFANIYRPLAQIAQGGLRDIPGRGAVSLDLVTVDYVAEAICRLLRSPRCLGSTYHLTAGPGRTATARELVEAAIRHAGRDPWIRPRFADDPCQRASQWAAGSGPELEQLSFFFAHLAHSCEFDDAGAAGDLGALAERRPHPASYLPRLFAFCRATRWGARMPWAPTPAEGPRARDRAGSAARRPAVPAQPTGWTGAR